mmetsp:Transcript_7445/g.10906  ORF Transcript_7445/g.10906 Transcript_7445/m.10906 type:complete len:92 (-) Transcript_7445:10-285(-)
MAPTIQTQYNNEYEFLALLVHQSLLRREEETVSPPLFVYSSDSTVWYGDWDTLDESLRREAGGRYSSPTHGTSQTEHDNLWRRRPVDWKVL